MKKIKKNNVIVRNPNVVLRRISKGFLAYDCLNGDAYELNHDAKALWDCCGGVISLNDLISTLQKKLDVDTNVLRKTVPVFLNNLFKHKLLQTCNTNIRES